MRLIGSCLARLPDWAAKLARRRINSDLLRQALPFQRIQHIVKTTDAQPSDEAGTSIVVLVTGELLFDEETNPVRPRACLDVADGRR